MVSQAIRTVETPSMSAASSSAHPLLVGHGPNARKRVALSPLLPLRRLSPDTHADILPVMQRALHDKGQTAPSIHAATAWVLLREMLSRPRS